MINLVTDLLGGLWAYVALIGAAIAGLVALYAKGRKDAARKVESKSLREAAAIRERMDNAEANLGDDVGVLRDSLRARPRDTR